MVTHRLDACGAALALVAAVGWLAGCAPRVRRFPLADPRWEDPDRKHVTERPDEYYSGLLADGMDKMVLRPLARLPYLPLLTRARNVNALDEVPNSSWFQNRIGLHSITPQRAAQGACGDDPPPDQSKPWMIVAAKPNGANPGFFVKIGKQRYLLKFDGYIQPLRATAADVIGSKIYWAAGYHAPCNRVVYFRRHLLRIAPGAKTEDKYGNKQPIKQEDIDKVLAAAFRLKDGTLRASASAFLPGRPLGPFRYEGTRSDDPNDHVPHQHRRELRGNKILAAWLNHHDAREQNSLDLWVEHGGRNYVRHYMIDFGDCFGGRWEYDPMSRRTGHAYMLDFEQIPIDYLTLGIYPRPWNRAKLNEEAEIFGYFGTQDFVADAWRTDYPNTAFIEARYDDALWMARIISRFTDAHIAAMVKMGKLHNKRHEAYLIKTLIGRRDLILQQYFTQYAPLDRFRVVRRKPGKPTQSLCFEDLAIKHELIDHKKALYKLRFYGGQQLDKQLGWLQFQPDPDHPARACIQLPIGDRRPADLAPRGAPDNHPLRYGELKIWIHQRPTVRPTSAIHLHFYDLGAKRGFRLVGIERPDRPSVPDLY